MIAEKKVLENIALIRKEKGYSQEYIATQLGLAQPGYALIEKGNRGLDLNRLFQIAIILEINVIDLFTYPKKFTDVDNQQIQERISVVFEVPVGNRDALLKLVTGAK